MQADRLLIGQSSGEHALTLLEQTLNYLPLSIAIVDFQRKVLAHKVRPLLPYLQASAYGS